MKTDKSKELVRTLQHVCESLEPMAFMEVCGTHTVSFQRSGVKSLLPPNVKLISGPGCPVCVSSQGYIDAACAIASSPAITICTYGDMLRVPGRSGSLQEQRAAGADVRVVYSPMDAVRLAEEHPERTVVFIAVGFETTVGGHAAAVLEAYHRGLDNFCLLASQKLVIPAMTALLDEGEVRIDGFLCPGHVSVIIGPDAFVPVVRDYRKPCVIAGFEPEQMLGGIIQLVRQVAQRSPRIENIYPAAVKSDGNPKAIEVINEVFEPADSIWRAMGTIPMSGLALRPKYRRFDALKRFDVEIGPDYDPPGCQCGQVLQGKVDPVDCPLFGTECTPTNPIGPCMVGSEGSCAAAFKYGRNGTPRASTLTSRR
ncbi:MAG: hydrogenase expression/formation protein [Phycisphaerae bacterium]|nr:MAG: hydrogenase expression/formation protein [Phycisphaerae bacterium]